jgi:hypothetical protein
MHRRVLGTAVGAVEVGVSWRGSSAKRPIIADINPEPTGLGSAEPRRQHRDRGVVTMNLVRQKYMGADRCDNRR